MVRDLTIMTLAKNNSEFLYYSKYKEIGSASSSTNADKNAANSAAGAAKSSATGKKSVRGQPSLSRQASVKAETLLVKRAVQEDSVHE